MKRSKALLMGLGALMTLAGCAHAPADDPRDPLEPVNRVIWGFNYNADKYVLRPVAKGYKAVTPQPVRTGITNFFSNLAEPKTIVNDALQCKFSDSASDFGRLLLNTTAGLGGFLDVATDVGLPHHQEDFGLTLGHWGVGEGWYLMLPFLGPSTNRDLVGYVAGIPLQPSFYLDGDHDWLTYGSGALNIIDDRANLLSADKVLDQQLDKYLFVRTAYLQNRAGKLNGGAPSADAYKIDDDEPAEKK